MYGSWESKRRYWLGPPSKVRMKYSGTAADLALDDTDALSREIRCSSVLRIRMKSTDF